MEEEEEQSAESQQRGSAASLYQQMANAYEDLTRLAKEDLVDVVSHSAAHQHGQHPTTALTLFPLASPPFLTASFVPSSSVLRCTSRSWTRIDRTCWLYSNSLHSSQPRCTFAL